MGKSYGGCTFLDYAGGSLKLPWLPKPVGSPMELLTRYMKAAILLSS